jgi:hypothetical protein
MIFKRLSAALAALLVLASSAMAAGTIPLSRRMRLVPNINPKRKMNQ